jgi:hypothetical protein
MITVFTLCATNYLAHAKVLGDSLTEHNQDFRFVIGLVDRLPKDLDPSHWSPYEIIPVEQLGIEAFSEMVERYDIVELSTAVKPFYFEWLYLRDPSVEALVYLDPDILVFSSLDRLIAKLREYNLVVTPHNCTFDDTPRNLYYELAMLSTGVFNLGFLGTSRNQTTFAFLKWWQTRVRNYCYYAPGAGVFVDQLWMILAPLYFPGVHVEKDPGYNMCYWNLFERRLSRRNGHYVVNDDARLVFYHFSSYRPEEEEFTTTRAQPVRISFRERPDVRAVYDEYRARLLGTGYNAVKDRPWLIPGRRTNSTPRVATAIKSGLRACFRILPRSMQLMLRPKPRFSIHACFEKQLTGEPNRFTKI